MTEITCIRCMTNEHSTLTHDEIEDRVFARLRETIGEHDESSGLEHWHHASGGRSQPTERDGVFVDRAQVLALLRPSEPVV